MMRIAPSGGQLRLPSGVVSSASERVFQRFQRLDYVSNYGGGTIYIINDVTAEAPEGSGGGGAM